MQVLVSLFWTVLGEWWTSKRREAAELWAEGKKWHATNQPGKKKEKKKGAQRHCRQERWREENRHMANTAQ